MKEVGTFCILCYLKGSFKSICMQVGESNRPNILQIESIILDPKQVTEFWKHDVVLAGVVPSSKM